MILHLSSNLQTQLPVLVQLKCQFPFRVFQNFQVFLPQQREEATGYPWFPCIYLMSFICTFAEHWLLMKKIRQKHNSSISFTLYSFALLQQPLRKKMKLNSPKGGKKKARILRKRIQERGIKKCA